MSFKVLECGVLLREVYKIYKCLSLGVVKCNSNVDVFESVNPVYYDGKYNCRDGFTRNRTECSGIAILCSHIVSHFF